MKILNLTLQNFRGIKNLDLQLDGHDAKIFGANGTGKTTIANAVCWLMAGVPATGEKGFDPKTTGTHGIRHSAAITMTLDDGAQITFSKEFYEIWKRKKGAENSEFSGNTTDYRIDGVKESEKTYNAKIEEVCGCSIEKIKMLLLLGYFAESLTVDERREILIDVCGDVTDAEVILENKLSELTSYLRIPGTDSQYYSTDQYKTIAQERKKNLNKDLTRIPERIDEVSLKIPETIEDEKDLESRARELERGKEKIRQEARDMQNTDTRQEVLRASIAGLETELETKRTAYIKQGNDANEEIYAAIRSVSAEKRKILTGIVDAKNEHELLAEEYERLNKMRSRLLSEYEKAQKEQWDEGQEICPTCGQQLQPDKIQNMREEFNHKKSQTKERINRDGQACSKTVLSALEDKISDAKERIGKYEAKLQDTIQRLENLENSAAAPPPFESTAGYTDIKQHIDKLQSERQSAATDAESATSEIRRIQKEKIDKIDQDIREINLRIAQVKLAKESQARIKELEQEKHSKSAELENVEHGIHLCDEFIRAKVRMVNDRINSHFRNIHFQLFKEQINGGLKNACDPMLQNADGEWVEYKSANTAAQTNAGLEIIDVLNKHYGTSLPVIMDRAESVCQVISIDEQLIRLIVSAPDEKLRVKIEGENEQ